MRVSQQHNFAAPASLAPCRTCMTLQTNSSWGQSRQAGTAPDARVSNGSGLAGRGGRGARGYAGRGSHAARMPGRGRDDARGRGAVNSLRGPSRVFRNDEPWATAKFKKNAVQLMMEWVQKAKPQSFPPTFTELEVDAATVTSTLRASSAAAVATAGANGAVTADTRSSSSSSSSDSSAGPVPYFQMEVEVAGIGSARGSAAPKKQDAKELACRAWLLRYVKKKTMLQEGWVTIAVDSDSTVGALGFEVMALVQEQDIRQALQLVAAVTADLREKYEVTGVSPATTDRRDGSTSSTKIDLYRVYNAAMFGLGKAGMWPEAFALLKELDECGITAHLNLFNQLIKACEKGGAWQEVPRVFAALQKAGLEPDVFTWNSAILAYSEAGQWQAAVDTLRTMQERGSVPDSFSYSSAISGCRNCHRVQEALQLYEEMKAAGVEANDYTANFLISAVGQSGNIALCEQLMSEFRAPPAVALTAMTYSKLMCAYKAEKQWDKLASVADMMHSDGVPLTVSNYNSIMDACGKTGQWQKALQLFYDIEDKAQLQKDTVSYNIIFDALSTSNDPDLLMDLYKELRLRANLVDPRYKLKPDATTCSNLVRALSACGQPDMALTVFDTMRAEGVALDTQSYNTAIGACSDCDGAVEIFKMMTGANGTPRPDLYTYNYLITKLSDAEQGEAALAYFHDIEGKRIGKPNVVSYNAAMSACRNLCPRDQGRVAQRQGWEKCVELHRRMVADGLQPSILTLNTMVLVGGRANEWEEPFKLFNQYLSTLVDGDPNGSSGSSSSRQQHQHPHLAPLQKGQSLTTAYLHMLTVLTDCGQWSLAVDVAAQTRARGTALCLKCVNLALKACAELGNVAAAETLFSLFAPIQSGSSSDSVDSTGTAVDDAQHQQQQFSAMQPDAESFALLLMTYWRAREPLSRAQQVIAAMQSAGLPLSFEVYGISMMMHADAGQWEAVAALLQQYKAAGLEVTAGTFHWALSSCSRQGLGLRALRYMHDMRAAGIKPDVLVYNHVIRAVVGSEQFIVR